MKWIQHDTDANQDAKLQNVLLDYGLEGYGLYWYCIELIAGKIDKDCLTFELEHDARIIARNTGSTPQKVEEMMRYFVKEGLFEDSTGVITCLKLAKRLNKSMTSNPQMREIIGNLKNHDAIMTESESIMQDKIRLDQNRIEKEVKSNKSDRAPSIDYDAVKKVWNETMVNSPKVSSLNPKRKRLVKKLFDEYDLTVDTFGNYLRYVSQTETWKWAFESSIGSNGVKYGPRPFDYFLKDEVFLRAKEEI